MFSDTCPVVFSIFGSIEVPKLEPAKVRKLTVVLVKAAPPV